MIENMFKFEKCILRYVTDTDELQREERERDTGQFLSEENPTTSQKQPCQRAVFNNLEG